MQTAPTWKLRRKAFPVPGSPNESEPEHILADHGLSLRLWRLYAFAWLVCLLFPVVSLVHSTFDLWRWLISLSGLAAFTLVYIWIMWHYPLKRVAQAPRQLLKSLILSGLLTGLILFLSLAIDNLFLWLFVGLSAIIGIILPIRPAFITVIALTLLALGVGVGLSGDLFQADWLHILPLALLVRGLGLDMIGLARLAATVLELHQARAELARMAVIKERLRMARDLHDLLGHTLSLITIKSELAQRLIEKEPARAAQEIREIELVTRQTMREVREAVAGYRQPHLESELLAARQMLQAAEITLDLSVDKLREELPSGIETTLAWTIREGVTNVIRHSRARRCLVKVECENALVKIEIINDGGWEQEPLSMVDNRSGSGLSGLVERVAAQGGRLEAGPVSGKRGEGFRLWVELPFGKVEETSGEKLLSMKARELNR